jgi:hypothetical protein
MARMSGGCACGAVRFSAEVASPDAYLCHCRMCQRATGSVSIAFMNAKQAAVTWDSGPDWYASSPIAKRPFCAKCGTSLGFQFLEGSENMDLTVASFDDADYFKPTKPHFGAESLHEQWLDTSALPRMTTAENTKLMEKWEAAGVQPG